MYLARIARLAGPRVSCRTDPPSLSPAVGSNGRSVGRWGGAPLIWVAPAAARNLAPRETTGTLRPWSPCRGQVNKLADRC